MNSLARNDSHRIRLILFVAQMAPYMGSNAMQSLLPAIGRQIGIPDTMIVSIFSLSAFMVVFSSRFWARRSDLDGRKPVILTGLAGFALSMLGLGIMVLAGVRHYAAPMAIFVGLLLARSLHGLIGVASGPAAEAYVADTTSREERTAALAAQASAQGLGSILGPAVAPFLLLPLLGLSGPLFVFAFWAFCMAGFAALFLPADRPKGHRRQQRAAAAGRRRMSWRDPHVMPFALFLLVLSVAINISSQTLGFLIIDKLRLPPIQAQHYTGIAMMAGALGGVFAQWGLIRILRLTPSQLLVAGPLLGLVGNLVMALLPGYPAIVLAYTLSALGYGMARPGSAAGASLAAPPSRQGEVAGTLQSVSVGSIVFAPILGVWLYQWRGPSPFLLNSALLAGLLAMALLDPVLRQAGRHAAPDDIPERAAATAEADGAPLTEAI